MSELCNDMFDRCYGFNSMGLRIINVFGTRQDTNCDCTAVIPKWTAQVLKGEPVIINGDGEISRSFTYVADTLQANLLAATATTPEALNPLYNVTMGERGTVSQLFQAFR